MRCKIMNKAVYKNNVMTKNKKIFDSSLISKASNDMHKATAAMAQAMKGMASSAIRTIEGGEQYV